MALVAYTAESSSTQQLSSYQLDIIKRIIEILAPMEEITRFISADLASYQSIDYQSIGENKPKNNFTQK